MKNIWKDAIFGVVVGDALGCPVQFEDRKTVAEHPVTDMRGNGTFDLPTGSWTDDSSLTLALLDSICKTDELDLKHIMDNFAEWLKNGAFTPYDEAFDVGRGAFRAIREYIHRGDPHQCGSYDEQNNGNGSLMRIMPACLYCYEKGFEDKDAIKQIHQVGSLTHAHIRSNIACGLYYFMTKAVLSEKGINFIARLQEGLDHGFAYYEKILADHENLEYYDRIRDLAVFANTPEEEIRSSGYVVDTLEAVLWSLINTNSFESALLKAVNLGNDSDTVGAIAEGLAGLGYGIEGIRGIPRKWMETIRKKEWIAELCETVNDRLDRRVEEGKPCIAFSMDDAEKAYQHMDREQVKDYGSSCGKNILHTWDDGSRVLMRCKNCGGYILLQMSEFHGMEDDAYYADYFPVSGPKEAQMINEQYDGDTIEEKFPHRWMIADGHPHWNK